MTRNGFRKARLGMILGGLCVLGVCAVLRYCWGSASAKAQVQLDAAVPVVQAPPCVAAGSFGPTPSTGKSPTATGRKPLPEIVAVVNSRSITREELAQECVLHFGKEVLEAMTNKYLILQECKRQGISITREEVDAEIERMSKRFKIPMDQWLKLLKQERGIQPDQYANDIIWPRLALQKLAAERLTVTRDELMESFESQYGPAIRARMIVCTAIDKARKVQAMAAAAPDDFGNLAKTYSEDASSACLKGLIQPIHKHGGCREIEEAAFSLADGGVSQVIPASGQFVVLKREGLIDARKVRLEDVAGVLEEAIRERRLRTVSTEIFGRLQQHTVVENVMNDPVKSRQMPGVAALINGQPVMLVQLSDECAARHGQEVLEGLINRKLIEMACKRNHVEVAPQEIDAEVARAARMMVKPLPDGSPDVKTWLAMVAKREGVSAEIYCRDAVWPSVALRKLAAAKIEVTEEDLKRGFEANYGPRVRCRAIVLGNLRRAEEVWKMAREKPTLENFSQLASKYSIESTSRALGGEVPPIRRYGGQPLLEQEAFSLKAGELSGVIQVEDERYVILFCEGYTSPVAAAMTDVRDEIREDVCEKKERLAMAEYFEQLKESASLDNFLTGTSKSPVKAAIGGG
ncbi:MAG: peptidylprolyl isomerase, partial [Thermoguttaceae bacterium]